MSQIFVKISEDYFNDLIPNNVGGYLQLLDESHEPKRECLTTELRRVALAYKKQLDNVCYYCYEVLEENQFDQYEAELGRKIKRIKPLTCPW